MLNQGEKGARLQSELQPADADVLVELFEWDKASAPQKIGTLSLGPCFGIAIYNTQLKEGYVGHFVAPADDAVDVERMVNDALLDSSPTALKAWVRGGSIDPDDAPDVEYTQISRNYVVSLFGRVGILDHDIRWSGSTYSVVDMVLDCETGAFNSIEESIKES